MNQLLPIPSLKNSVSLEEWRVRVDLAALYRIIALYGWDDLVFTHISARVPGADNHFLLNPVGLMFEEVTASSLIKVDFEGQKIDDSPYPINTAGFVIHSAIHMNRADAHCVVHLHTTDGIGVSMQKDGLLPLSQHAMGIGGDLAYHDYEGYATDLDERQRLVRDIGDRNLMILRNHGTMSVGRNCAEAFTRIYYLERACSMQVRGQAGGDLNWPGDNVATKLAEAGKKIMPRRSELAWPALLRKLDRMGSDYAS
jgi:ribulose-5-phosphate 4-epimerase/fuculose-1-phosphate aldolase